MKLTDIDIGQRVAVSAVSGNSAVVRRLRDMGIVEGTEIVPIMVSPLGDPRAYSVFGAVIAIRARDAENIAVVCHD